MKSPFQNPRKALRNLVATGLTFTMAVALSSCGKTSSPEESISKAKSYIAEGKFSSADIELKNAISLAAENPDALREISEILLSEGRYRDAFRILARVVELDSQDARSNYHLASIELSAGLREQAGKRLRTALKIDPNLGDAAVLLTQTARNGEELQRIKAELESLPDYPLRQVALGNVALQTRDVASADSLFQQASQADPNLSEPFAGRFLVAASKGQVDQAESFLRQAAENSEARSATPLKLAIFLERVGKKDEAFDYGKKLATENPDFLPFISYYCDQLVQRQQYEEAKELTERILQLDALDPTGLRIKGVLLAIEEKYDEAADILERTLKIYPKDLKTNFQLSVVYLAQKKLASARNPLEYVVSQAPQNSDAALLLANVQMQSGDVSGSIITLRSLLRHVPDSMQAKLMLAEAYNKNNDYQSALSIYNELGNKDLNTTQVEYLSGVTQMRAADLKSARESFETALRNNPEHVLSLEQLTTLDIREQSFEAALQRINQSIDLAPDNAMFYLLRAQIWTAMGDREKAKTDYQQALEIDAENRSAKYLLSRLLLSEKKDAEAIALLEDILKTNPSDIGALVLLSTTQEQAENLSEARATYQKILEVDPNNLTALNNLSYLISKEEGPTDAAIELAEKARKIAPTNPYTTDTLGWLLYQRGDYRRAKALISESLTRLPRHPEVAYHSGVVNYHLGDLDVAKEKLVFAVESELAFFGKEGITTLLDRIETLNTGSGAPDSSLENASDDPIAQIAYGRQLQNAGKSQDAYKVFESSAKKFPQNVLASIYFGEAQLTAGEVKKALDSLKSAYQNEPNNARLKLALGKAASANKDYRWAVSLLTESADQYPENGDIWEELAKTQLAVGALPKAAQSARKWGQFGNAETAESYLNLLKAISGETILSASDFPQDNTLASQLALAVSQLRSEDYDSAQALYTSVLKDYPEQGQAMIGTAKLLILQNKDLDRANSLLTSARRILGSSSEIYAESAKIEAVRGNYKTAADLFNQLPADYKSSPAVSLYWGIANKGLGNIEEAKAQLAVAQNSSALSPTQKQLAAEALADL